MDKLNRLKELEKRFKELTPIISKSFDTQKELDVYYNENLSLFEEYEGVRDEIKSLKLELMTPKERKEHEIMIEKIKKKRGRKN